MPGESQVPSTNKNQCPEPGCGNLKTSWSQRCQFHQGERVKLAVAIQRHETDLEFLSRWGDETLATIAKDRGISRERARQLKAKARRRIEYFTAHAAAGTAPAMV